MKKAIFVLPFSLFIAASAPAAVIITTGTYTENFDSIGSGLPSGWGVYTGASATSLGTAASFVSAATSWGVTSPQFRNSASTTGLTSTSGASAQSSSTDRALSIHQGSAFGNPGGSFDFYFSTLGVSVTSLSFDASTLNVGNAFSTWSIQYGIGASPVSWTTFGTYTDSSVWGSTALSFSTADFEANLDNQSDVWFRFVSLSTAVGTTYDTIGIDNFTMAAIASVPEPGTLSMLVAAGVSLMVFRFRKRQVTW